MMAAGRPFFVTILSSIDLDYRDGKGIATWEMKHALQVRIQEETYQRLKVIAFRDGHMSVARVVNEMIEERLGNEGYRNLDADPEPGEFARDEEKEKR